MKDSEALVPEVTFGRANLPMKELLRRTRETLQQAAPEAAEILVEQMQRMAEISRMDVKDKIGRDEWARLEPHRKYRFKTQHERLQVQAARLLHEYLEKILAYSLGHPTQEHRVTVHDEVSETAAALVEYGPKFLQELRQTLIEDARQRSGAEGDAPGQLAPGAPQVGSEIEE